jgi:hypothetical protein
LWFALEVNRGLDLPRWFMTIPSEEEAQFWKTYKVNKIVLFVMILGWVPFGLLMNFVHPRFHIPWQFTTGVIMVWLIATMTVGGRLAIWPCPQCRKSFRGLLPFLPKRCRNCGYLRRG